jgi:hypothetical protein
LTRRLLALGRCALGYMDDVVVFSATLEQHLLDVAEVLEIFRRRKLYAKASKCEFGRQALGFLGQRYQVGHRGIGRVGVALGLRQFHQLQRVPDRGFQLVDAVDLVGEPAAFTHQRVGGGGIIPQAWVFGLGVQFVQATGCGIPVKDASLAGTPKR